MTKTSLASVAAAAAALPGLPASSDAATVGSDLSRPAATTLTCTTAPCTLAWAAEGWNDVKITDGQIVTGLTAHLAPSTQLRVRLVRKANDGTFTGQGASEVLSGSAAGGVQTLKLHLPAPEYGSSFALEVLAGGVGAAADPGGEFGVARFEPALAQGQSAAGTRTAHELLAKVTAEGDADGDGKADQSEDDCVTGCTPASAPASPSPAPSPAPGQTTAPGPADPGSGSAARPAGFSIEARGLLRAGAQGDQGWFDVYLHNDGRVAYDGTLTGKAGRRSLGTKRFTDFEGGDRESVSLRLDARTRKLLRRKGTAKIAVSGVVTQATGAKQRVRQAVTVTTGGDRRYDGEYRGPGPFVLTVERGAIRSITASVLGYCPQSARQQQLSISTVNGFPALVKKDGSFDIKGQAVSQENTYRGRLTLEGTGKGYASAFRTVMNMSSGGRFVLEGCTGATDWTVRKVR